MRPNVLEGYKKWRAAGAARHKFQQVILAAGGL